jgi:TRAP transporter TAXI family solute receptor
MQRRDACLGACALLFTAGTSRAEEPLRLTLGTATPGGGFPVYGAAFVETLQEADAGLLVEPRNTRGSAENLPLLEAGKLDLGLVQGEPAYEFLARRGGEASAPKVVAAMYGTAGLFVVRADGPLRSIGDLRGKPVALGAAGSGLTVMGRAILRGEGLDPEKDIQAITLERAGDGPAMVADGRAAALFGGGVGWPGFKAVAEGPGGARFLAPSEGAIARLLAANPGMRRLEVPAGTYPGQETPLVSVGSWSLVLCRANLPDEAGFRIARALDRGRDALARGLPQGRETHPANTVAAVPPAWLQPGVARYLREAGYLNL